MPRSLEAFYPNAEITVAEIDPGVSDYNYKRLELSRNTRIQTVNMDARLYLAKLPSDRAFDIVFGDAVNDFAVPHQITTVEFDRLVNQHLTPHGWYVTTIIDDPRHGQFTAALIRTLQNVFPHVYLFPLGSDMLNGSGRNTFEILASSDALDEARWKATRPRLSDGKETLTQAEWDRVGAYLSEANLKAFLEKHSSVPALTDDYAPTDNYLAPLFIDAYTPRRAAS